jgi:hypothetical protein
LKFGVATEEVGTSILIAEKFRPKTGWFLKIFFVFIELFKFDAN